MLASLRKVDDYWPNGTQLCPVWSIDWDLSITQRRWDAPLNEGVTLNLPVPLIPQASGWFVLKAFRHWKVRERVVRDRIVRERIVPDMIARDMIVRYMIARDRIVGDKNKFLSWIEIRQLGIGWLGRA